MSALPRRAAWQRGRQSTTWPRRRLGDCLGAALSMACLSWVLTRRRLSSRCSSLATRVNVSSILTHLSGRRRLAGGLAVAFGALPKTLILGNVTQEIGGQMTSRTRCCSRCRGRRSLFARRQGLFALSRKEDILSSVPHGRCKAEQGKGSLATAHVCSARKIKRGNCFTRVDIVLVIAGSRLLVAQ